MARLGVLKGSDVRCLSSTFLVVVFFACVFLLTLQPSQYPTKLSMVDLPKDEVVRAQSIAELDPNTGKTTSTKGKDNKKGGKNDQKDKKKANKAKWLKDELPKKAHNASAVKLPEVPSFSEVSKQEVVKTLKENVEKDTQNGDVKNNTVLKVEEKSSNVTKTPTKSENAEISAIPKSPTETEEKPPKPRLKADSRKLTPFSNLSKLPLTRFMSPFIDTGGNTQKPLKKIVTWYKADNTQQIMQKRHVFDDCRISECKVIYPLPPGVKADAVIFNGVDKNHPPPERTHKDQVYVFHVMEPPSLQQPEDWTPAWNTAFNWTWTYRRDSDIWQPFGLLKKARKVKAADFFLELAKTKTKVAAWMPKTCPRSTSSKRDEYVSELKRYIPVAEFGKCFNKTCAKDGLSCSQVLSKKFFFLLALEDDLCKDHVTEVFYRAWHEETYVVPVVRGGADYSAYFPEGTFVDADWFDSPKQLADFLLELMASKKLYSELLWRKSHWVRAVKSTEDVSVCHLCYKLHHLESNKKRYHDMQRWYGKGVCKNPRPIKGP